MNILLVAPQPFFTERGTPIAVRVLVEALCAEGHKVDLLTMPFGEDIAVDGLRIFRCAKFPGVRRVGIGFSVAKILQQFTLLAGFWRLTRRNRYAVVHAVEESIFMALLFRWRHGAPVIYDRDSVMSRRLAEDFRFFRMLHPVLRCIENRAVRKADVVVTMSEELADESRGVGDEDNVFVLHDIPVRSQGEPAAAESLRSPDTPDACLAVYVGNLENYQGIELLVEAVGQLPADCKISIAVVGGPPERVLHFRALARSRGLTKRIRFVGPRPLAELDALLAQADFLLSPRTRGGTPLKIYSYMAAGRAILATRLGMHTQVLDDTTAVLARPAAADFAQGLEILAADPALRDRLARAAKLHVSKQFSADRFFEQVRQVYDRAAAIAASAGARSR